MKRIKILFFVIALIAIGFIINIKYVNNNNSTIDDSTKEDYYEAKEALNPIDGVRLSAGSSRYQVDFPNGTTKYYNSIGTAVGELVSNSKFTLLMSINVNYTTPIVIGARGVNNITFDLNGYKLTKPNEGADFFHIAAHNVDIISSRPGGTIEATVNDPNSLAIRVLGEQKNWLPKVTIGEGVKVLSNGDSAIINRSGILVIDGATVKSNSFYAIQSYMLGGADRNPQVVVNNDSIVFGIYAGLKNESWYGGDFYFNDGIILPYTSLGDNRVFKKGNSSLVANNVYINKISTARLYVDDLASENKHNHDIFPADKTTYIEGGNYYLDEIIRYQTVTYESYGGVRTSTNQAPESEKHYFNGSGLSFPTDMVYAEGTGIKFVGWYSNSDYTTGPYSGRNPYHTEDRTYYARYTYELTYDANIPANDINKAFDSNGNSFTTLTRTENTGSKIYATTPSGLTRPGYTLVGWSSNPDTRPDATSNLFSPGSGVNWFLPQGAEGKRTIYAIWQPDYQVQYQVRYFYENYDGTFTENNTGHSTYLYRTNFPGTGLTNPDGQQPKLISHELSQSPEHISERRVQIKGDGSSVAKVYYTIKRYTVIFEANGGTYKTDGSYDGSGGVYTVLHGQSIGTKSYFEAPYGYEYFGWDFGSGNVYNVTSSFTVKPLWSPKQITYTFDYKIANQANVEVVQQFDDTLNTPANINRDGILFLGWYRQDNNELHTLTEQIKSLTPLTLYAKWTYEDIVAVDPIKSVEDKRMDFKSNPSYEYALIKSGVSLNQSTTKWFQPKGYNSWYTGLRPNTSYELHMRIKGDEPNNLEPSNIVYVTFKTKYLPLDMITDYLDSNNQIVFRPGIDQSYVVRDNEGNIVTPIEENGKLVYTTDPTKQYSIYVKTTVIDDLTGEETEVEVLVTNKSPISYDDFKDNIDILNNYYESAIDKINTFPFLTEEEKKAFENDVENAVNNVYQQVLENALNSNTKESLETIVAAAESLLTNAANQVINAVNSEAIKEGFKGLIDNYHSDYSSQAVDALRTAAKDLIENAESILELENILDQYESLISNKMSEEIMLANEKANLLIELNDFLNNLNEEEYYKDDWNSLILDYNNFLSLIEEATLETIADLKENALLTLESYITKLDYQSISINELDNYLTIKGQTNYSTSNWDQILLIYNETIDEITNTTSSNQLDGIVSNAKAQIDQIETLLETAINDALLSLENDRDDALSNLDLLNYLSELEKQEYINNIVDIYTNGVTNIDESNSLGDVTFRLNNATSQIQNNVDLATDKNISNYKDIIITDLSNFMNGFDTENYSLDNWVLIQAIYNNSLNAIDNTIDLNVLSNIYTQTKLDILDIKTLEDELNDYKEATIVEVKNHFDSFNITNYETSEWIRLNNFYNQAINNINKSELEETIDLIKTNTIDDMDSVQKSPRELMSFYVSEAGSDEIGNGTISNPYKSLERAYLAITEDDSFIILLTDVKVNEPSLTVEKKITITSQGRTYSVTRNYELESDSQSLIKVTNGGELTLTNVTLDGKGSLNNINSEYSLLDINDNSKLNILINTTLKNSHSNNASVIKANSSEITIQNATIKENLGESLIDLVDSSLTIYNTNITNNLINSETKGLINVNTNTSLNEIINISGNILFENNGSDYAGDINIDNNVTFEVTNNLNTNLSLNTTNLNYDDIFGVISSNVNITGEINNYNNEYLHYSINNNNLLWDYYYGEYEIYLNPTREEAGTIRSYAIGNISVFKEITIPKLNLDDYTHTFDSSTNNFTYELIDQTNGSFLIEYVDQDLINSKNNAISNINTLVSNLNSANYSDENWLLVQQKQVEAIEEVNKSETIEEVNTNENIGTLDIQSVKTLADELQDLIDYKNVVINNLNNYVNNLDSSLYSGNNWSLIEQIKADTVEAINASNSVEEVDANKDAGTLSIDSVLTLAQDQELTNAKQLAIEAINSKVNSLNPNNYSEENWTLIEQIKTNTIDNINSSDTVLEVNNNKDIGLSEIDEVLTKEEELAIALAIAKAEAKDELNNLLEEIDSPSEAVTNIINTALAAIESQTTLEGVELKSINAKQDVTNKIAEEILAQELKIAKDIAIDEINELIPDGEISQELDAIINTHINLVNNSQTIEELSNKLDNAITEILDRLALEQAEKDLINTKELAVITINNKVNSLSSDDYSPENWALLEQKQALTIENINNSSTIEEVNIALADGNTDIDNILTFEAEQLILDKAAAKAAINSLVAGLTNTDYSPENWALVLSKQAAALAAIEAAETAEAVDTAKVAGIAAIEAIETLAEEAAKELAAAKEAAEDELNDYLGEITEPSEDIQKIITDAIAELEDAATIEEVQKIIDDAKAAVEVKVAAEELALDKEAAKAAINGLVASLTNTDYSETNWALVLSKQAEALQAIEAAEAAEAVDTAKVAGLAAIGAIETLAEEAAKELAAAKAAAEAELNNYLGEITDPSEEVEKIITDAIAELVGAADLAEVQKIIDDAKAAVEDQQAAEVLEANILEAKGSLRSALETYIKFVAEPSEYLVDKINQLVGLVDEYNYDDLESLIDAGEATLLALEKAEVIDSYNTYILTIDDLSEAIDRLLAAALEDINKETEIKDVKDILAKLKDDVKIQQDLEALEADILETKKSLREALEEYIQDVAEPFDYLEAKINQLVDLVDETNYIDFVSLREAGKAALLALEKAEVTESYNSYVLTIENPSEEVKGLLTAALAKINTESEIETVKDILTKLDLDVQMKLAEEQLAKDAAITKINNLVNGLDKDDYSPENWQLVLDEQLAAIAAINQAETFAAIDTAKEAGIAAINSIEQLVIQDETLKNAKLAAKEKIELLVDSLVEADYSPENWQMVLEEQLAALATINKAETIEEVQTAKEAGIAEIEAILTIAEEVEIVKDLMREALEEYIKDVIDDNNILNDMINSLVDAIDDVNYVTLDDLINEGKDLLYDASKDVSNDKLESEKENTKNALDNYVNDKFPGLLTEYIDEVKDLIDNAETIEEIVGVLDEALNKFEGLEAIVDKAKELYEDLGDEDIKELIEEILNNTVDINQKDYDEALGLKEILDLYRDELISDLDDLVKTLDNPSDAVYALVEKAEEDFKDLQTKLEFAEAYNQAIEDIVNQQKEDLSDLFQELTDMYNKYTTKESYQYSAEELLELDSIYDIVKEAFNNDTATKAQIEAAKKDLDDVEIVVSESVIRPDEGDEKELDEDEAYGVIEFEKDEDETNKLDKGTKLVVEVKVELSDVDLVINHIDNKDLLDNAAIKGSEELYQDLKEKEIYGQLEIYLVDKDNNKIPRELAPKGIYTVSILIPVHLRAKQNIRVLYLGDDIVEVFDVVREGNWLTFKTDHFSNFYLMGDPEVLQDARAEAIDQLNAYLPNASAEMETLIADRIALLMNAATVEEIADILADSLVLIQTQLAAEQLDKEKLEAKEQLNNYVTEDDSDQVKDILAKALIEIDKAESTAEINQIVEKTMKSIDKARKDKVICLWWLILLIAIAIVFEAIALVKKRKDNKQKRLNALVLPLLATVIKPAGAWIIILIELIIALGLLAYLIYLYFEELKPFFTKEKKEVIEVIPTKDIDVPLGYVKVIRTIYDYSFKSRLHLNDEETDYRYNELKNHLMSYSGMTANMSWKQETFTYKGKMVAKLRLQGKTLRVYLGLDPKSLDSKYKIEDNSHVKSHQSTPTLQMVKGPRQLSHAIQLVDLYMLENAGIKLSDYQVKDYTVKKLSREKLIKMGLIRVQSGYFLERIKGQVEETPKKVLDVPVVPTKDSKEIYDYSFKSRLHLNDEETDYRYNELKNHLMSYSGVTSNMSWKQETFIVKGKMVLKLRLQGKTIRAYLGLDPKELDAKYKVKDNSSIKSHESTPTLQIVKGPLQLRHAKELIDLYMKNHEIDRLEEYKEQDFTLKKMNREKLIKLQLIKVQNAEFLEKNQE